MSSNAGRSSPSRGDASRGYFFENLSAETVFGLQSQEPIWVKCKHMGWSGKKRVADVRAGNGRSPDRATRLHSWSIHSLQESLGKKTGAAGAYMQDEEGTGDQARASQEATRGLIQD